MKKKGVTKKKRNLKLDPKLTERICPPPPPGPVAKTILYSGKLDKIWGTPLGAAKWIAEEIRTNPSVGWRLLRQEVELRRNVKGYLPKMMQKLGEYLEQQQPVFDQVDYDIVDIVQKNPDYTIKQITTAVWDPKEKWTEEKWDALEKRVRRLLRTLDDKMDYAVAAIVKQHPHYSVKEITSALSEKYPNQKWDTLLERVRQLLNPR